MVANKENSNEFRYEELYFEWGVAPVVPAHPWSSQCGCGSISRGFCVGAAAGGGTPGPGRRPSARYGRRWLGHGRDPHDEPEHGHHQLQREPAWTLAGHAGSDLQGSGARRPLPTSSLA
jgi:hypothetical protein